MTIRSSLIYKTELDFNEVDSVSQREEIKKRMNYNKQYKYDRTKISNDISNKTLDLAGYLILNGIKPNRGKNTFNKNIKFFDKFFNKNNFIYNFNPMPDKLKLGISVNVEGYNLNSEMKLQDIFDIEKLNKFILGGLENLTK